MALARSPDRPMNFVAVSGAGTAAGGGAHAASGAGRGARAAGRRHPAEPRITLPEALIALALLAAALTGAFAWARAQADRERIAQARADALFLQSALVSRSIAAGGLPADDAVRDYAGLRSTLVPAALLPEVEALSSFTFVSYERLGDRSFRLTIRARDEAKTELWITDAGVTVYGAQ